MLNHMKATQAGHFPLCKRGIEGDFATVKSPLPPFYKGGDPE